MRATRARSRTATRKSDRVFTAVAISILLPLTLAACGGGSKPKHFPGAIPGRGTNVSISEAFRYYGLKKTPPMHHLRYVADSSDDTYPLGAVFTTQCQKLPVFISASRLRKVSERNGPTTDVEVWAEEYGWSGPSSADKYYARKFDKYQTIVVLVHKNAGNCKVYVTS